MDEEVSGLIESGEMEESVEQVDAQQDAVGQGATSDLERLRAAQDLQPYGILREPEKSPSE